MGDPINAAVSVIAQGIAGGVLHVADELVVPVHDVKRSVGGKLQVHRPKVGIAGDKQVLPMAAAIAGSVIFESVLFGAEKADAVVQNVVALHFVREMAAGDKFQAGGWTDAVFSLD